MTPALFPHFKKSAHRAGVRLVGPQLDGVNVCPAEQFEQFRLRLHLPLGERGALALVARVHFNHFAGLGVLQNQPAQRGQLQFETIGDLDRDDIVPAIRLAQDREGSLAERF